MMNIFNAGRSLLHLPGKGVVIWSILLLATPLQAKRIPRRQTRPSINEATATNHLHLEQKKRSKKALSRPDIYFVEDDAQSPSEIYALYLKACYLHTKGKAEQAFKAYQDILAKNPPPYAYDGFFHLLFDTGQFTNITSLYEQKADQLEKAFKDNLEFQLIVAQAYLNTDQDAKAEKLFTALGEKYPDNEQVAYYAALSLIQNKQTDKALAFIDECIKKPILHTKHFLFYFLKSKIYLQNNQPTQALAMIDKSLEMFPKFDRGWLFKSILLEQQGKITDAISGYKKFLDLVGSEEMIEKQLIQLLFAEKRYSEAAHYLKKMKSTRPEYSFDMALIEFKATNYDAALQHVDACLAKVADYKQARLLKVEILLAQKKAHDALAFLQDWLAQNPHDNFVIHTMLLLRKAGVPLTDLIKSIETVNNRGGATSLGLLGALADLCIENEDYKKGIGYYQAIFKLASNEELKQKIVYHIAYVLFATKEYKNLDAFIPKALKIKPISPDLCNLVAFYYVQTNQKLDQALELVEQALVTDQTSPYYLDTKGLILIKMGKKNDAITTFETAHEKAPDDMTIVEHLNLAQGNVPNQMEMPMEKVEESSSPLTASNFPESHQALHFPESQFPQEANL